jgi:ABC-type polysaccharide/polyol phosphate transport system ATPase subunit
VTSSIVVDGVWEAYRRRTRLGWRRRGEPHWALRDVSVSVPGGGCLGVIGGNGSGKTTLLQVVGGVLRPTRGRVEVRGRLATLVDLSAGFHRDLTGRENLLIGGVLLGLSREEVRERLEEIVAFSGLDDDAVDAPLAGYSAGMGLRLGFSLVVCSRPDVLLVDEVLAVGDDAFQRRCLARIRELRDEGCAVMFVSHDMGLIREHTDETAVLERGELAMVGPPEEAVAYHVGRRGLSEADVAADRGMFDPSARGEAARRRRGVR